jgi:hypothetical protein
MAVAAKLVDKRTNDGRFVILVEMNARHMIEQTEQVLEAAKEQKGRQKAKT